jgi:hypothetical protein
MIKLAVVLSLLFFMTGCSGSSQTLLVVQAKGLADANLNLKVLLFINSDTGYIAGSDDSITSNTNQSANQFVFVNQQAVVFKTTDGGKSWKRHKLDSGYVEKLFCIGNNVYAINRVGRNRTVYVCDLKSDSWKQDTTFPANTYEILSSAGYFIAISRTEQGDVLYRSVAGKWEKEADLEFSPNSAPVISRNRIYYSSITNATSTLADRLVAYDMDNNATTSQVLPTEFICRSVYPKDEGVLLFGVMNDKVMSFSIKDTGFVSRSMPATGDFVVPTAYFGNGQNECIVMGKMGGFAVTYKMYISNDYGKTWKSHDFIISLYITPFSFVADKDKIKAWFYSGNGDFQILMPE